MSKRTVSHTITALLCLSYLLMVSSSTQAFIERRYTLEEVISECTNIVFGTVTDVNRKRMTAKVKVEENLKGKSEFEEIKINIGTGQEDFPQKLIKQFEVKLPVIIFYKEEPQRIPSLGHINGTWFQTFAQNRSDKSRVWWNFSHIEIYMHRTYKGSTPDFQKHLRDVLGGKNRSTASKRENKQDLAQAPPDAVRVLVLADNRYDVEFSVVSGFGPVGKRKVVYQKTKDRDLPNLSHANILWIGQGAICESEYFLTNQQERKIKTFVKNGGVVIVTGQDSDDSRPCPTGWLAEPLKGVERQGRSDFKPTGAAGVLFKEPNWVKSGQVFIDDTWTKWSDDSTVLATTNQGKDIAVAMLEYGRGMYLITGFQNETSKNIATNRPMMENLIHFAVNWLKD